MISAMRDWGLKTRPNLQANNTDELCDINIAVNRCSRFTTSTKKGPFTAMLMSCSRGTYLIVGKGRGSELPKIWSTSFMDGPSLSFSLPKNYCFL